MKYLLQRSVRLMLKKFKYLVISGLKKKFTSKAFIITNAILLILVILISNLNNVIKFFGGDFSEKSELKVHLVDETNKYSDSLAKNFKYIYDSVPEDNKNGFKKLVLVVSDKKLDEVKEEIKEKDDIIIEIKEKEENILVNLLANDSIDNSSYQQITSAINMSKYEITAKESNISDKDLIILNTPANIEKIILNKDINDKKDENRKIIDTLFPIFILPFYILIIQLINNIGAEINEEKSSKSMEVIISSISAKTHFYSKIISNNIFVIGQMLLFLLYGLLGLIVNNILSNKYFLSFDILNGLGKYEFSSELLYFIPLLLVLVIATFFTYSLLTGILVSMTVNNEDLQHVSTPLIMISLIGYYLAIASGFMEGSTFIKVLSYIPLVSCFLAPGLFITGQITLISFIISIISVFALNFLLVRYGIRIYKIGILNYSTDKMWRKLFKAVKE